MLADKLRASTGAGVPQFISSSSGYSGLGAPVVTTPNGIQLNDLITVIISCTSATNTIEVLPVGFIQKSNSLGSGMGFYVATKIATVSEPSSYTFTTANTGDHVTAMVFIFRNATNINTIGTVTKVSSSTQTAASITPSYVGALIAAFGITQTTSVTTPPSSMTLIQTSSQEQNTTSVYYQSNDSKVATSSKNITFNTSSNGYGVQFQITNEPTAPPEFVASSSTQNGSVSSTLTINKPVGTVEGDLMVAVMSTASSASWIDTTFTEVADQQGITPGLRVAYKVAGSSEPSNYTFTTNNASLMLAGSILTYRYAAYDTIGAFTIATNPLILPSISPSENQSILLAIGARPAANITLGTPTSMTARAMDADSTAPSYIICDQTVTKGPVGTRSMTTGSATGVAGIMLSIKPTRGI